MQTAGQQLVALMTTPSSTTQCITFAVDHITHH